MNELLSHLIFQQISTDGTYPSSTRNIRFFLENMYEYVLNLE